MFTRVNPSRGASRLHPRLQRHFFPLACVEPSEEDLRTVFGTLLGNHLAAHRFAADAQALGRSLISASVAVLRSARRAILASSRHPEYWFHVRDVGNIISGLCRSHPLLPGSCGGPCIHSVS